MTEKPNAFRQHYPNKTAALKAAGRDLDSAVGVDVHLRRDRYGVEVTATHPKGCKCGACK